MTRRASDTTVNLPYLQEQISRNANGIFSADLNPVIVTGVSGGQRTVDPALLPGGLHPNEAGYTALSVPLQGLIQQMVARL